MNLSFDTYLVGVTVIACIFVNCIDCSYRTIRYIKVTSLICRSCMSCDKHCIVLCFSIDYTISPAKVHHLKMQQYV